MLSSGKVTERGARHSEGAVLHSGGGRVRLITARPARRSDEELLEMQGGLCAGCQGELTLEGPTSRWAFRSKPSNKVLPHVLSLQHADPAVMRSRVLSICPGPRLLLS